MKKLVTLTLILSSFTVYSQTTKELVDNVVNEVESNSKLEQLAHELFDVIGPRLVGTPQMKQAHDWAIKKYESWGIEAYNHEWGKWRGWERGVTHIYLIEPRYISVIRNDLDVAMPYKKGSTQYVSETLKRADNIRLYQ